MSGSVFTNSYRVLVENMVAARKAAGLTQVELAVRLAKPQSFISKIERCERRADVIEFCMIAKAIGLAPDRFLAEILAKLPDNLSA